MSISSERISKDIEAIAGFNEATADVGYSRPTFSPSWRKARDYIISEAEAAGCKHRVDAAGNVHVRPASMAWDQKVWLSGSHIDSVPTGGKFDGVIGIVCPLEVLRSTPDVPMELIIFAEEEGSTFGYGMIGSRLWTVDESVEVIRRFKNQAGQDFFQAGESHGVRVDELANDRFTPADYLGLIEIHIEQGPAMWETNIPVAVVTAIAGRKQYKVTLTGVPNHAGSTPMSYRVDALTAAAKIITGIEVMAPRLSSQAVATVGRIECEPNAINVIPGRVSFTIDLRSPHSVDLVKGDHEIRNLIQHANVSERTLAVTESQPIVAMDSRLCERIGTVMGNGENRTISGALHDAAVIAPHLPTAMIFVASKDGISHNPVEFSRIQDISVAATILEKLVARATISQLNAMSEDRYQKITGGLFEHSPWVAQRAFTLKPFASIDDLHEKMCNAVKLAKAEEQLSLINAHPDLVGRLAKQGRLTRESTVEQAAAGLMSLTADEAASFEKYNAAYRARFGFPFIICARQNKKEAILAAFPKRLTNTRDAEISTALSEIYKIARLRLADAVWEN